MNFLVCILFLSVNVTCGASSSNAAAAAAMAKTGSDIVQLADGRYVASKLLPYTATAGNSGDEAASGAVDQVYFVCERLTFSNWFAWSDYAEAQEKFPDDEIAKKINSGVGAFQESLQKLMFTPRMIYNEMLQVREAADGREPSAELQAILGKFEKLQDSTQRTLELLAALDALLKNSVYDIWIVYCTRKEPSVAQIKPAQDVEMVLTVFASHDCPFTSHMGIMRSGEFFKSESKPHKNLAMQLHAFAALAAEKIYGPKFYMITHPADNMTNIIVKDLASKKMGWKCPADMLQVMSDELIMGLGRSMEGAKETNNLNQQQIRQLGIDSQYASKPLNNLDARVWFLMPPGGDNPVEFLKPAWFPHKAHRMPWEHSYLGEGNPSSLALDFAALIRYWYEF